MEDQGFANPQEKVTIYSLPAECDVLVKGLTWEGCELVFIPCPVGVVGCAGNKAAGGRSDGGAGQTPSSENLKVQTV